MLRSIDCPFQYIPCYGLSSMDHVELGCEFKFQYIPCYGLSTSGGNYSEIESLFQYIPCYGLSYTKVYIVSNIAHFNTSHVTVYPLMPIVTARTVPNFNTSHVTVYLMILSHFYLGIFHHFLYFTSFQHFLPADYKI